ncbi:homoserine O-acetyltransferase MetX [Agromyces seonyuensis]|uniref:Homoserine O-acetyltransferase n=1 Tax=Agromyces seonyuensis TaxID=2662446 RepID=A0A6I4NWQ5_9MICO|nr:homoserine O-acetyltransferase [Agromyces seonyuensis]MWB98826.1 homoserine O-acetyltransferase [Agromyces seonyuensis]
MDWQRDSSAASTSAARVPVTGAWREGDPVADRRFVDLGSLRLESGRELPRVRVAYETWGEPNAARDNAVLVLHALTGDAHVVGAAGPGQPTAGWWPELVGPGLAIDTDRWWVIAPNVLGGCQGTTGPASVAPDGAEWGSRFPRLTIRDQVAAQAGLADALGIERFAAVVGGSMGGMHALEWGVGMPERVARVGVLAAPPATSPDQLARNSLQLEAVRLDPRFADGDYYDAESGPWRGLALARRMAMLEYRSGTELDERFGREWQSALDPHTAGGRYAVESYLDFHGNRFTRRFDANSYLVLTEAMNSHDVARGRGALAEAVARVRATTLVLGITSDRYFPLEGQRRLAAALPNGLDGHEPTIVDSPFGHDAFLLDVEAVGAAVTRLLAA